MTRIKEHKTFYIPMLIMSFFISILSGCSGGTGGGNWNDQGPAGADTTRPTVILTVPVNGATVATNAKITAKFSEAMAPATITAASFTVRPSGPPLGVAVAGTVTYKVSTMTATFTPPVANLAPNTPYTATVTVQATDLAGNAMAVNKVWTFTTGAGADAAAPLVTSTLPANLAVGVLANTKTITATFNEDMDPSLFDATTFTLQTTGPPLGALLPGAYSYNALTNTITFAPTDNLAADTSYTATVTNGVTDLAGNPLVVPAVGGLPKPNPWTFRTAAASGPVIGINLGKATTFGIAATAGVTNTNTAPLTTINGDVVLDPVSGAICNAVAVDSGVLGTFGLCAGSPPTLTGTVYSAYFVPPGGSTPTEVVTDLKAAYLSITPPAGPPAAGSLGGATNLPAGTTLGAPTGSALVPEDNYFTPGVYQSLTSILITDDLTLDGQGDPNAIFIFQSSSTVGTADGAVSPGTRTRILLINGAKASNVWWQAGTSATLGLYSEFQGNILASESITMKTGATSCGRLLAGAFAAGAFVFDANVVSVPGQPFSPPAGYSTTCQ